MSFVVPTFDNKKLEMINSELVVYKSVKGENLKFSICYPKNKPRGTALFIHGGGWKADNLNRLLPHAKYLALCGMVGVSVDYTLNSETTDVRNGLRDCVDALNIVRKIVNEKYGKELKIAAIGDSAGGYYAVCLGSQKILSLVSNNSKIVDYVVDLNGIVDLTGTWGYGINANKKTAIEYSPLFNVSVGDAPVLILHGDKDKTVDIADAFAYKKALEEKKVKCDMKVLHGAAHAFILFDYRHENNFVATQLEYVARNIANEFNG